MCDSSKGFGKVDLWLGVCSGAAWGDGTWSRTSELEERCPLVIERVVDLCY